VSVDERGEATNLKGWLSDVLYPVLLENDAEKREALARRLGGRGTIDDPIFGRASGSPALERMLAEIGGWLQRHKATYVREAVTVGIDRDVTEGSLTLDSRGREVKVPIAVVTERRPSREVELRVYYSTRPLNGTSAARSPVMAANEGLILPPTVQRHVDALKRGEPAALVATFDSTGSIREASGERHTGEEGLRRFYERLFGGAAIGSGVEVLKAGAADDGRTFALEYTLVRSRGRDVPPQAGLALYERSDTGLIRELRVYDDSESGSLAEKT
jgi:hypothetical protein